MDSTPTDWTSYYVTPSKIAEFTRRISRNKIHDTLSRHSRQGLKSICELGGANSCFVESFLNTYELENYHVIDNNEFGLRLLDEKYSANKVVTFQNADVLNLSEHEYQFDLVYSIGLIEHFTTKDTKKSIASHFTLCKSGGLVLIAFPTPTFLYRVIRSIAEFMGLWHFPDERPLEFNEVSGVFDDCGAEIIFTSINWKIGLTQGYVLARKN